MKRLYYFAKSLTSVQGITSDLRQAGIGENRLHVMGNDSSAMARAQGYAKVRGPGGGPGPKTLKIGFKKRTPVFSRLYLLGGGKKF